MSDSVQPHRQQPTRLLCPWDSPGKNTGVGCRFLLQCIKVKSESEVAQLCPTLRDPVDYSPPGSSVHGIFQARVLEWGAIASSARFAYLPLLLTTYLVVKYHRLPFARSLYILNLAPFSLCHRLCKSQFKAMFLPMFHYKFVYLF